MIRGDQVYQLTKPLRTVTASRVGGDRCMTRMRADERPFFLLIALLLSIPGCAAHADRRPMRDRGLRGQAYQYRRSRRLASHPRVRRDGYRPHRADDERHSALRGLEHPRCLDRASGRLVYEEILRGRRPALGSAPLERVQFDSQTKHDIRSVTKSVIPALVGIAVAAGPSRPSIGRSSISSPEHSDLATPEWRRVKVRHALTMSAGLAWEELGLPYTDPRNGETPHDQER